MTRPTPTLRAATVDELAARVARLSASTATNSYIGDLAGYLTACSSADAARADLRRAIAGATVFVAALPVEGEGLAASCAASSARAPVDADAGPICTWRSLAVALGRDHRTIRRDVMDLPPHLRPALTDEGSRPYFPSPDAARAWWQGVHAPPERPEPRARRSKVATRGKRIEDFDAALDAI